MRKKIATAAVIAGLGLTGGLLVAPGLASADTTTSTTTVTSGVGGRLAALQDALKTLVADKTLTQAQADKVAATLEKKLPHRGKGMKGGRHGAVGSLAPEQVAKVLGMTSAELRTELQAGKTLAQVATAQGVGRADLIAGLVKAAEARLAQAVSDGRLTQAQADTVKSSLRDRITERIDQVGKGPRGWHRNHEAAPGSDAQATPSGTRPSDA